MLTLCNSLQSIIHSSLPPTELFYFLSLVYFRDIGWGLFSVLCRRETRSPVLSMVTWVLPALAARRGSPRTSVNCTLISTGRLSFYSAERPRRLPGETGQRGFAYRQSEPELPVTALQKFTSHKGTSDRAKFHAVVPGLPGGFWTKATALK